MGSQPPLITLENITIQRGSTTVLDRFSWVLGVGESWALLGGNGSGKTTLLRLLQGHLWPDAHGGRRLYRFPDNEVTESPVVAGRLIRTISAEQQDRYVRHANDVSLLDVVRSGWCNVVYPQGSLPEEVEARALELLERVGLGAMAERSILAVSHGQARAALIARALLVAPRLLLLDEVYNGLDPQRRRLMSELIDSLIAGGTQVIITSHRAEELPNLVTQELELSGGQAVYTGPRRGAGAAHKEQPLEAPEATSPEPLRRVLMEVHNASVHIEGELILPALNWCWREGEHWMITGENGSGKTTFLRLLYGDLVPALGGAVRRLDLDERHSIWEIRQRVGYVAPELQARHDGEVTALDVVASGGVHGIGLHARPGESVYTSSLDLMAQLGILHLVDRPLRGLSYGQLRQLLIARALLNQPSILLLDEPWNGLDRDWCHRLTDLLSQVASRGTHLLAVSHHTQDGAGLFNRSARFKSGRLLKRESAYSRVE